MAHGGVTLFLFPDHQRLWSTPLGQQVPSEEINSADMYPLFQVIWMNSQTEASR